MPDAPLFRKVLVANRGEIAIRVFRTLRELQIGTVAVYSEEDRQARHTAYADEAYLIGPASPAQSYLNGAKIIEVALEAGVDAIHPGYGFLAENAEFARACVAAGIVWIGPPPEAIEQMGSKTSSREIMQAAGVPIVPGDTSPVATLEAAAAAAEAIGYPIAVKASAGGGGKGFRVALSAEELEAAFEGASREGEKYFNDPAVYLERYLHDPRHIEVQVLADEHGSVVHLGERDCSIQRRHQKIVEECPSPFVDEALREQLGRIGTDAARAVGYRSAGTVECLMDSVTREVFFLEMNTRVQVEHTITEAVTGIDIVAEQVRIAAGLPLGADCMAPQMRGHAIECRINAEDARAGFRPSSGLITVLEEPMGPGVRVDEGFRQGDEVSAAYDSLIAKLIVWGRDREQARLRMLRALDEYRIEGVETLVPFHRMLLRTPEFIEAGTCREICADPAAFMPVPEGAVAAASDAAAPVLTAAEHVVEVDGQRFDVRVFRESARSGGRNRTRRGRSGLGGAVSGGVTAPIPGNVLQVRVAEGDTVVSGQLLCIIEAMKMENEIVAPAPGVVRDLAVCAGDAVAGGQHLMRVDQPEG